MTQSVQRIVQHGFEDLLLHQIELRAATENTKSWQVAEKVVFSEKDVFVNALW